MRWGPSRARSHDGRGSCIEREGCGGIAGGEKANHDRSTLNGEKANLKGINESLAGILGEENVGTPECSSVCLTGTDERKRVSQASLKTRMSLPTESSQMVGGSERVANGGLHICASHVQVILPRICGVVKALSILLTKEEKDHGKSAKDLYGRV
jgi:hypothetical protein